MIVARTSSADETRALGEALASLAHPGDVVVLAGDLGAGKTALAQGFGAGLDVKEPITSPTFVIARTYEGGRLRLNHLDVYRLEHLREVEDIGLAEMVDDGAVTLIEWGDAVSPVLPASYLEVRLTFGDGDDDRTLVLRPVGPAWAARTAAMTLAVAAWAGPGAGEGRVGGDDGHGPPAKGAG